MLLLHQTGGVKVGEVVRYTVSYTPSRDSALPAPDKFHVRIRNTSAATLRAAVLAGPFTISPMVKAGAHWNCDLRVPDEIRQAATAATDPCSDEGPGSEEATVSWVIEISSQIIFTTSAVVGYEVMVATNPESLKSSTSSSMLLNSSPPALTLKVEDTAMLWNSPSLLGNKEPKPRQEQLGDEGHVETGATSSDDYDPHAIRKDESRKQKKVHLVIITHGLHSTMGADMLFLKESIDDDDDDDDEEVIVRGYSGNATKTQRGIKFLGKRVAKYVLSMTYPDQPYLPTGKAVHEGFAQGIAGDHHPHHHRAHKYMPHEYRGRQRRSYKITSISFIGHSLGGPTQTYAIAYIQKHCPSFFDLIKPRNFITLASPLLGVSNENPFYVRFALESGFVGRSGRDLGLSWGPMTAARSGWGTFVGSKTEASAKAFGNVRPETKPLLRILPTGPAHTALKKFQNRTVYGNIVNDGIVPLRTSSLLFLDWQNYMGMVPLPSNREMMEGEGPTAFTPATALVANAALPSHSGYTANAPLAGFFKLFKANAKDARQEKFISRKHTQMLSRGQTFNLDELPSRDGSGELNGPSEGEEQFRVPPTTSFFEGVGDLLNPAVADVNFLINPNKRPKTILHDRVYLPSDIPPAPAQRQNNMLVEEKIARSYHRDMSWRKVLVKLEPDAHNNISVRRMFVNSYGWPVIKHLVDTHFSDAAVTEADRQGANLENSASDDTSRMLDEDTLAQLEALQKTRRPRIHQPGNVVLPEMQCQASSPHAPMEPDGVTWNVTDWLDSADESDEDEGKFKATRSNRKTNRSDKAQTWHSPSVNTRGGVKSTK
ncbi:putative serine esterase [Hirsutella rhossiliensis]|uniref:Serine esterase n=1 Tax=Hirsutella rhossiliensis TaxID=111463 RepID=A0A9P8N6U5_9HYPO|nr:putative serine esterase [Hirsutella rhossiliensis]KAH0967597.1 putative serine esterase [Hirsutella rhossiliensis]